MIVKKIFLIYTYIEIIAFIKRERILKNVPRVRIELTTFRFLLEIMRLTRCLLR